MRLLQEMGVNVIRQHVGIPPRWITYIYEKYGIYTVINHTIGRYGMTIDQWLIDRQVVRGTEEFGPYTCADGNPCLFDADDLGHFSRAEARPTGRAGGSR